MTTAASKLEELETTIAGILASLTGLPAVNSRQPGTRPNCNFLEFIFATAEGTDWPLVEHATVNEEFRETITDAVYFTVQITGHGLAATAALHKLRLLIRSQSRTFDLFTGDIGVGGCSEVANTSTEFNGNLITQAAMTLSFYALLSESQAVDFFERIGLDLITINPDTEREIPVPEENDNG
jgi:hypothetical protein